ncbi:hypothetical protein LTR36_000556 [Oleoguttula mirabilis]|uniref:Uncharacterized protein n=1 Tax=Oleoguttula mirabilis TaxID=1507867 RepID=A0AAV9JQG7_9PEZI|nr:hypothetical protein LTR36_000556 [Oleoguttula mirabilis]
MYFSRHNNQTGVKLAMRAVLQAVQNLTGIRSARLTVPRLECEPTCTFLADGTHGDLCQRYTVFVPENDDDDDDDDDTEHTVTADEFDQLANELGVVLENGCWDFGELVVVKQD